MLLRGVDQSRRFRESGRCCNCKANSRRTKLRLRIASGRWPDFEARINEYQGRLNSQPGTEQQLADLNRGYEQSKANYDDLLKKKNQSAMATSMEQYAAG